jgi:hypothetical protein
MIQGRRVALTDLTSIAARAITGRALSHDALQQSGIAVPTTERGESL